MTLKDFAERKALCRISVINLRKLATESEYQ
jgi:hypothetical protein